MQKPTTIAVDIDDTLANHVEIFVAYSNIVYGTNFSKETYLDNWEELWQVSYEEADRRAEEFQQAPIILTLPVLEESHRVLTALAKHHTLYIVSARRERLLAMTLEWLDEHFPNLFQGVHFVPIWEPNNTVTKADICREIGADYLIDDVAGHCNIAAQAGMKAVLFGDYNWNRNEPIEPGVTRCASWTEVGKYFGLKQG